MQDAENPKCKRRFDKYLSLDKGEIVPFRVALHLLFCAKCRTAARAMRQAERLLRRDMESGPISEEKPAARPSPDPIVEAALRQIEEAGLACPQPAAAGRVSLKKWVAGGAALILCLAAFPFTAMGGWASGALGIRFLLSFYTLTGIAVAVYTAAFIGCNLDFFVKRIESCKKAAAQ